MKDVAKLWWTANDTTKDITFELHVKTTGWVSLGIGSSTISRCSTPEFSIELLLYVGDEESRDADMAIGWVDKKGKLHFEVGLPLGKGF